MKAVFFDFGRTIVEHPEDGAGEDIVRRYGITDCTEVKLVRDALFSLKGAMKGLDDASISRDQYEIEVLSAVPCELHDKVKEAMSYPIHWLPLIDGMEELLAKLKKDGFKLYIASNMDLFHAAQMREHRTAKYFDGMVFSSEIRVGKPKAEYFEKMLKVCSETAENSLFIDDLAANVEAAESLGIKGLVFKGDALEAEKFIYENK